MRYAQEDICSEKKKRKEKKRKESVLKTGNAYPTDLIKACVCLQSPVAQAGQNMIMALLGVLDESLLLWNPGGILTT